MAEVIAVDAFQALLPAHECSLTLEHNPHRVFYQSLSDYLENIEGPSCFASAEEEAAAIAADELWDLQWYPDTPVGFCRVLASSLQALMKAASEMK